MTSNYLGAGATGKMDVIADDTSKTNKLTKTTND